MVVRRPGFGNLWQSAYGTDTNKHKTVVRPGGWSKLSCSSGSFCCLVLLSATDDLKAPSIVYNGAVVEPPSLGLPLAAALLSPPSLSQPGLLLWHAALGLVLLAVSAFFVAGISVLSNPPLAGSKRGKAAAALLENRLAALASSQLGRSLATIGFIWLIAPSLAGGLERALAPLLGAAISAWLAIALALIALALLLVILVQQGVKVVADRSPETVLNLLAPALYLWRFICAPLSTIVIAVAQPLHRLLRLDQPRPEGSLRQLLDESIRVAELDEHEQELVGNIFAFKETTAGEVMVPRPDVVWLSIDQPLEQLLAKVSESGHTRFPLCDGGVDNVIGYLHAKDLAPLFRLPTGESVDWRAFARPVAFVPEVGRAITALRRLQRERSYLAIVVDEFGGMAGIVTLEDLLEELVGDIQDEFDEPTLAMQALDNGEWIVAGAVRLDELEELGLSFGAAQEGTVGGYIFGRLAREVVPGDEVAVDGAALRVEAVEGLRVIRVRVIPAPPPAEELMRPEAVNFQQLQPKPN